MNSKEKVDEGRTHLKRIVLATHNRDKARELQAILRETHIDVLTLDDFPHIAEIPEDGMTLEENALKKARTVFDATRVPALADDSGLEVHYLNMEPGVFSSRYSGPGATYESNCKKLLEELRGVPPRRRAARFRCVLALVASGVEKTVEGICQGSITEETRGFHGFGYDPVFLPIGHRETLSEMGPEKKNRISHRFDALQKIKPIIEAYMSRTG